MLIDCDTCTVRGLACGDCVVSHLLGLAPSSEPAGPAPQPLELDAGEQAAFAVLAGSGLVPPLRLVPGEGHESDLPAAPGRRASWEEPGPHGRGRRPRAG